ncbi:MAG: hypothetical protein HOP19_21965 [Acidobacteria bacterium]|nr:hypothetical protein [Acidobacteriota bacterium]
MFKQKLFCHSLIAVLWLTSLPLAQAQTIPARGRMVPLSTYRDDPFVRAVDVEALNAARFSQVDGRRQLRGDLVTISEESKIYRFDEQLQEFKPFAWNPWPIEQWANGDGDFSFPDEARFPLFKQERDAEGKVLYQDGLQVWTPNELRLGATTAFAAAHAAKDAAEAWAGRAIAWGVNGTLDIEAHVFIDFNAFYSAGTRSLFFAVVPYRLPGETDIKIFETATCWEMVAHECGHALHDVLKPNIDPSDQGFNTWGESFGDQTAMWTSLQTRERVRNLLAETGGNLNQSNSLTRFVEAFAALTGKGTGTRDAFHDLKISDTTDEVHDRSQVLTGAAYQIFLTIYDELKCAMNEEDALQQAGQIMGFFLMRAADYSPENQLTLEHVAQAYLKVDKEFFGARYHARLVEEFTRREIFDADSVREWQAHEAALPQLWLRPQWSDERIEQVLNANLNKLGIGPDFGLRLQSVTRLHNSRLPVSGNPAPAIVRLQLTRGRGADAEPLDNHGLLVFRASGMLSDYHAPLMTDEQTELLPDVFAQAQALTQLNQAARLRLDDHGAPLALVRQPDGRVSVAARVLRGAGLNTWMEVFTPEHPQGERREILISPLPPNPRIRIAEELLK